MTSVLLVYPPFCSPVSPPYSLANLYARLSERDVSVKVFDANVWYYTTYFQDAKDQFTTPLSELSSLDGYKKEFDADQKEQIHHILNGNRPAFVDEILNAILAEKPSVVAFSLVFSSQVFVTSLLLQALKEHAIKTVVGGPAVSERLVSEADLFAQDHDALLSFLNIEKKEHSYVVDYAGVDKDAYFTSEIVYPLKSSSTCHYRKCAFCTHHTNETCVHYPLEDIEMSIVKNRMKYVFFIDDMIPKNRLLAIAKLCKSYDVKWMCQLKPIAHLDHDTLKTLYDSGLRLVIWGVESGSDRVLKKMRKGTSRQHIVQVLKTASTIGIHNVLYIMFGFPTETKDEFLETIDLLEKNTSSFDLVSSAVFGLQAGSYVYEHPEEFSITEIREEKRTFLDPAISYVIGDGLTTDEAKALRNKFRKTLRSCNTVPKSLNVFREHHLLHLVQNDNSFE